MTHLHAATRRQLLIASGTLFAWAYLPKIARAEGRDPRLLVIVLRGALDGLAAVAPVGDPEWVRLRGDQALTLDGKTPALPLDSFFALNPAMPNLHRLYQAGAATIVHAAATPYRERSHFDGQDVLESGLGVAALARGGGMEGGQPRAGGAGQVRAYFAESAGTAAKFLARPDGPRIGALAFDGWDTHANEGAMSGRLATLLGALDGAIAAIETEMKDAWRETVVAIVTEFGRTARINGSDGTDHGTATVAVMAGGELHGRRVVADCA